MAVKEPKYFLICGGTSRAGLDVAKHLVESGTPCIVAGRHPPSEDCDSEYLKYESVDFSKNDSVISLCKSLKKYDIQSCIFFQRSRGEDVLEGVQVAIVSSATILEAIKENLAANKGSAIFIGSILGSKADPSQTLSYHVSKGALNPLMQYLAVKYGRMGIRVNLVSLSTLKHSANTNNYASGSKMHHILTNLAPMQRPIDTKDLLDVIRFLSDPKGPAITGQELHLDAGLGNLSQIACAMEMVSSQKKRAVIEPGKSLSSDK